MTDIEKLQEENKKLKEQIDLYTKNGAVGLYYELNRFVNGTVRIMRNQTLESLLTAGKDEDAKKFERMMALIKNAKEHTTDMATMKVSLKLTGDEEKDKNIPFIELIADTRR